MKCLKQHIKGLAFIQKNIIQIIGPLVKSVQPLMGPGKVLLDVYAQVGREQVIVLVGVANATCLYERW